MPTAPNTGSDSARVQLRGILANYFHAQEPAAPRGYHKWTIPAAGQPSPKLLVGDPVILMENLKIFKQYAKLLTQACHDKARGSAHSMALSPTPTSYPKNLEWFEPLSQPFRGLDRSCFIRVEQLLELDLAWKRSDEILATPAHHAFQLAKSLPHFERDLVAYYLKPTMENPEYELHVAYSIMRLHNPATLEELQAHLKTWRHQGLLHVLSVAALNMPTLASWFPVDTPNPDKDMCACSLSYCIESLQTTPGSFAHTIESFIDTQDPATPTAQAIAVTIDRLAVLMGVKSNAELDHDLSASLASLPELDTAEISETWALLKPALEKSLPPSCLRVDPAWAVKRSKLAAGTW